LPGGGGLTAPLWTADFRVVSAVVGAWVLRLLVVFVPRTSSTSVATWFWLRGVCHFWGQTEQVHLVGVSIAFEKNFYRLPFTALLSCRRIGPSPVTGRRTSTIKRLPPPIPRRPSRHSSLCPARAPPSEAAATSTRADPPQCPTEAFSTSSRT
jgi:hypothetical protein